jgi:hypothetical protein
MSETIIKLSDNVSVQWRKHQYLSVSWNYASYVFLDFSYHKNNYWLSKKCYKMRNYLNKSWWVRRYFNFVNSVVFYWETSIINWLCKRNIFAPHASSKVPKYYIIEGLVLGFIKFLWIHVFSLQTFTTGSSTIDLMADFVNLQFTKWTVESVIWTKTTTLDKCSVILSNISLNVVFVLQLQVQKVINHWRMWTTSLVCWKHIWPNGSKCSIPQWSREPHLSNIFHRTCSNYSVDHLVNHSYAYLNQNVSRKVTWSAFNLKVKPFSPCKRCISCIKMWKSCNIKHKQCLLMFYLSIQPINKEFFVSLVKLFTFVGKTFIFAKKSRRFFQNDIFL